ncbi:hypothetical protein Anas_05919 [Armadillidium nasatum]|uniref:Uncharacterized protein n=1 Tax=Armadillidium nasatum TaxID=96803 RepID=A0A5N5TNM3_9CRUS|nr:hypothetical protein Anas_05919 [Armadillidium nasatum]
MANGSFFEDYDNTGGEKLNDSPSSSQSPSPSETKEKETTTPVNIRDEICSSLSKWKHWKKKTITFAEDLHSNGTLDDEAQSLLEDHMDELISLTKKWRSFLNIKIECEVMPCKKVTSPERFSLTSWSSLEWESPRDDAIESKSKDEDQILDQSTLITVSDPSKDITEKDSKIGDLLSPLSKKGTPLSRNQDVFNEPTNVSSTSAREEKKNHQIFPHKQNLFMKCCGKVEETSPFTSPATVPSDDEAVVSSSTESSILYHEFPITADDIKSPKTPEETRFFSSDFQRSISHETRSRTLNDVSIASHRSRKIVLFVVGILSIILSVCSILSYLLRKEAQKWCYNNPHLRGHGSWIPFFHVQYSGEPPY